jgi:flavin-binding protein dodecin
VQGLQPPGLISALVRFIESGSISSEARVSVSGPRDFIKERIMDHVYKTIEITGSSTSGLEASVNNAIAAAGKTLRNLHWFEVSDIRGDIENGKVKYWQTTLKIGFRLDE